MKKRFRFQLLMLCLLLVLPLLTYVQGEEAISGEQVTYVLNHRVDGDDYSGPDLQYFSPYRIAAVMDSKTIHMKNCIFSLYNTVNDEVIPVYCTDISVLANPNYTYRRINLEDSTYAAGAADEIRAIVRNGFYLSPIPGETDEAHAIRVKQELQRLGAAAGVPDLTIGEAITGTQAAIWQVAHGSALNFTDLLYNMYLDDVSDSVRYYDICDEERNNGHVKYRVSNNGTATITAASDAWVGARIRAVYSYLLSLDPLPPSATVVSPASFRDVSGPFFMDNGDGTADVLVTVTVSVQMEDGDDLTLTASMPDGKQVSRALYNGVQSVLLTLENVPSDRIGQEITLTIEGMQSGFDVYLFDSEGDRETSQSMVGMDDSRLPVYASIKVTSNDRILNFYKTTMVAAGSDAYERHPLEGITFDIYFVAELRSFLSGQTKLPEAVDYEYPEMADYTLVTDEDGRASINFTQKGMSDGVYLVVERKHPAIIAPVDPFYVIMPTTNAEGTGYEYEITVQPKNDVKGRVWIEKDVVSLGNDSASVDAYGDHTWIIGTNIPEDIANGKSFSISDTLDPRLDYAGNLSVCVESVDGKAVLATLTEGIDYILSVTDADSLSQGKPSDAFTVSLTRAGMAAVGSSIGESSFEDYMLRVRFRAHINANGEVGVQIPNQAVLQYTNSVNFDFTEESDKPVVYTGGARLLKVDALDASLGLPGATFEVYRYATADELSAGIDGITHIPGVTGAVIKAPFFDNDTMTGEKVTTVTSDKDGKVHIYGLAYGEYFLMETEAPSGYNLLNETVKLTVDGTTHMEENIVTVENISGTVLPATGGAGTCLYILSGIVLILAGAAIVFLRKRNTQPSE